MGRIGNDIVMGYYKTPLQNVGEKLLKLIEFDDVNSNNSFHRVLDPCCGEGELLNLISSVNDSIEGYGVELDSARFNTASKYSNLTIEHAAYEQMVCSNNSFSLVYNNPPYQDVIRTSNASRREESALYSLEYDFLVRATKHLAVEGVHIFVVSFDRLTNRYYQNFLVRNYYDFGLCRFNDDEFSRFKQVVLFARKKNPAVAQENENEEEQFLFLVNSLNEANVTSKVPTIDTFIKQGNKWRVPTISKGSKMIFYPKISFREDFSSISEIPGFDDFLSVFKKESSKLDLSQPRNQPKMDISDGQLGVLIMSGVVRIETGEGENYHLAQGSEEVYWENSSEILEYTTKEIKTQKRKAKFCVATPMGLKILE